MCAVSASRLIQTFDSDNLSATDIIPSDIPASQEGVYIFYNPPLEPVPNEICVNSAKSSKTLTEVFVLFFCNFWHSSKARLFIASLQVLAVLNFQNACFVYKWQTKSEDRYQIGSGISLDTRPAISHQVMHFSQ